MPMKHEASGRDQASRLRRLVRRHRRAATTLAIISGKGGVGKSNVAVNLAVCLAAKNLRVALVDLDLGLANADLLMNVAPRYTVAHLIDGSHTIDEICVDGPCGVRFLAGASGLEGLADLSEFERQSLLVQLHTLELSADIVVLDCAAGLSRNVLGFACAADRVVVVTAPEPPAITDAYAAVKTLARASYEGGVSLFVNRVEGRADAQATYDRLSGVARKFLNYSVAYGGYMVHDTAVGLAVQARCPFVIRDPGSNASACMVALANKVARDCSGDAGRGGFFRRVAGLFV